VPVPQHDLMLPRLESPSVVPLRTSKAAPSPCPCSSQRDSPDQSSERVAVVQGSAAAPSVRQSAADVARSRLKAAIKSAWSREAVARGVAAAKKADYALAHRRASSAASLSGAAAFLGNPPAALCPAPWMHVLFTEAYVP